LFDISVSGCKQGGDDSTAAGGELITVRTADFAHDTMSPEQCQAASDSCTLTTLLEFAN
jgi:hypothetical protein